MSIIRLATCYNVIEASFIKHTLENEGIDCFLTNELSSTLIPFSNGVMNAGIHVMIEETDLERASSITNKEIQETVVCPNCHSTNIKFGYAQRKELKMFGVILSLLVMIPFSNIKRNYYCKNCKTEF